MLRWSSNVVCWLLFDYENEAGGSGIQNVDGNKKNVGRKTGLGMLNSRKETIWVKDQTNQR